MKLPELVTNECSMCQKKLMITTFTTSDKEYIALCKECQLKYLGLLLRSMNEDSAAKLLYLVRKSDG